MDRYDQNGSVVIADVISQDTLCMAQERCGGNILAKAGTRNLLGR